MKAIEAWQRKAIYALGGSLGIVERGNPADNLHLLIEGVTGKTSVSTLTEPEATAVIAELKRRMQGVPTAPAKPKQRPETPGGVTGGQQGKIWRLMYRLAACDAAPSSATIGDRLCGVIRRELHMDATAKNPFQWMDHKQGNRLIEILKGYVAGAEKKAGGGDAGGYACTDHTG